MTVQELAQRHHVSEVAVRKKCGRGSFDFGGRQYVAIDAKKPGAKKANWIITEKGSSLAESGHAAHGAAKTLPVDQLKTILLQAKVKKEISAGALLRQKAWEGRRKIELDFAERFLARLLEAFGELRKLPEILGLNSEQTQKFRDFLASLAARADELAGDPEAAVDSAQEED
jgi:hypothetical protein